jgi:hypothetical protein
MDSPPSLRSNPYQLCETPLIMAVIATASRHEYPVGFRFRDLSAALAMAVRSLGLPTTMSFRLAIGH